jgi:hypothetical protein
MPLEWIERRGKLAEQDSRSGSRQSRYRFPAPAMATVPNIGLRIQSGSTTKHSKREIRSCAYCHYGSCLYPIWEGESGAVIQKSFSWYAPDSPSPSACRFTSLVWSMMAFDPTTGKTPRYEPLPSLPLTLPGSSHAIESATARGQQQSGTTVQLDNTVGGTVHRYSECFDAVCL